jgi:hypothetical protein
MLLNITSPFLAQPVVKVRATRIQPQMVEC